MARIPVRFERVAAAFAADSAAGVRLCESSGSEYSPESLTDLSDLVNLFMERDGSEAIDSLDKDSVEQLEKGSDKNEASESFWSDSDQRDSLRDLLGDDDDDDAKRKILYAAKVACEKCGDTWTPGFKRRLMAALRKKGFDAGLCKSKWEKSTRYPAGDYEYIDVNVNGTRYIVETLLAGEFQIARPTDQYASLVDHFPAIFVGEVNDLKQIVRLMCNAIRESLKCRDMPMPPWRRNGYMQAKWFGAYKRTTRAIPSETASSNKAENRPDFGGKRSVGFAPENSPALTYACRSDFGARVGLRVSHLTAAFNA